MEQALLEQAIILVIQKQAFRNRAGARAVRRQMATLKSLMVSMSSQGATDIFSKVATMWHVSPGNFLLLLASFSISSLQPVYAGHGR